MTYVGSRPAQYVVVTVLYAVMLYIVNTTAINTAPEPNPYQYLRWNFRVFIMTICCGLLFLNIIYTLYYILWSSQP